MRILTTLAALVVAVTTMAPAMGNSTKDLQKMGAEAPDHSSRDQLWITGSTTMDVFTHAIAESVASKNKKGKKPIVQSDGSTAGIKEFCKGIGVEFPDIVAASRRMRKREFEACLDRLVLDIIELKIGYSALVVVTKRANPTAFDILPRTMYLGLAATVPGEEQLEPNAAKTWYDVNPLAPKSPIKVYGPGPSSGSRGVWDDLMMEGGCRHMPQVREIFGAKERVKLCTTVRSGDFYVDVPEPYYENAVKRMMDDPDPSLAIVPHNYYDANSDTLQLLTIEGIAPSKETISSEEYHLANPLYYYVKRAHMRDSDGFGVVRGLREFIGELMDDENIGPNGNLIKMGLSPLPETMRLEEQDDAIYLKRFTK
jgi:phosphate transport system substrate-binding protein